MNPLLLKKQDNYSTPRSAWEALVPLLDKTKVYYDPFFNDGLSGYILSELGLDVIHEDTDFFESVDQIDFDIIVSNPPFSIKRQVLKKLLEIDKPFVMIMPISVLSTKMYQPFFDHTSIGVPKSRIQFSGTTGCPFDCYYYFYKVSCPSRFFKL